MTIHSRDCPRALEVDPARSIDVVWQEGTKASHPVKLKVICLDKPGLLADISRTITASDVDIRRAVVMTTKDKRAICSFDVSVNDASHLSALIKAIEKVKNVYTVERERGRG